MNCHQGLHNAQAEARYIEMTETAERDLSPYLASTPVIDYHDPVVAALAAELAEVAVSYEDLINRCFTWVRDEIGHSADIEARVVTCTASHVLREKTGLCYAKSHLLAALLRANGVPTGFCYQHLSVDGGAEGPYCLHGLNAVWLNGSWFRIDCRGNRPDIHAKFTPPVEQLAFLPNPEHNEYDLPGVLPDPLDSVVLAMQAATSLPKLWANLPDI